MSEPIAYLVIIDGQGETEDDFTVLRFFDTSPEEALEQAIAPNMGYGKSSDCSAYVVAEEHVAAFVVNDTSRRVARRVAVTP